MCGSCTSNHSNTRIRIRPYFVEWKTQHLYGWMNGRIFQVEQRTRGSTALKQCLTAFPLLDSTLMRNPECAA